MRRIVRLIVVLGVLLLCSILARAILLGGAQVVNLAPASAIGGVVAQNIGQLNSSRQLPVEGSDFRLSDTKYFEGGTWVVTTVTPIGQTADTSTVVLQKINGLYKVVLGPGTDFSTSYAYVLPDDVVGYLNQRGVLHGQS